MKCIFWNVRRVDNLDTCLVIKSFYKEHKPDIFIIVKPTINHDLIQDFFWNHLGLELVATNDRGRLTPNI